MTGSARHESSAGGPEQARFSSPREDDRLAERLFAGPGEMRARCRSHDWRATPLGPIREWPESRRIATAITLASGFPGIVLLGPELIQVYNDGYIPFLGIKHPRGLGMPTHECWPEARELNSPVYARVFAGETITMEDQLYRLFRRGPGALPDDYYLTLSYSPIPDEMGGVGGVFVTIFDTTDQVLGRRAQAERDRLAGALTKAREGLLEDVFRQSPSFLAVLRGPDNVFELANDAYYRLVGRGRDVLGKPMLDALPEVRGQGFEELMASVRGSSEPMVLREVPVLLERERGAGLEQRYLDLTYLPLEQAGGAERAIIAHGADVTERVRAEREMKRLLDESERARRELAEANGLLQDQQVELELSNQQLQDQASELEMQSEQMQATTAKLEKRTAEAERAVAALAASEQQLRTLADAIPTLAWTARSDGYIDWYNARWYEYTGSTPAAMAGWGWETVHDPAVLPQVMERWQASIATGQSFEMVFPLRGADGRFRSFLTRVSPVRDESGRVVRWFGTNTDVDAERAARAAAEAARAAAEGANEAKTTFLTTMSHELRTPLNAIAGYAELLELGIHGPVTDPQREALSRIQRSQRHLLGLINDVLNFAKLEAGHVEYALTDVAVSEVVDALEPLVAPQLRAKSLRYDRSQCLDRCLVRADPDKVQQVLINLLSNAVKFTAAGGAVTLQCRQANGVVSIAVQDTGIGIPADRLEHVFAPFVQVDRRLNSMHEGTGLGLAISRDLARGMGGDLTAESTPGVGSTFTLTLPAP